VNPRFQVFNANICWPEKHKAAIAIKYSELEKTQQKSKGLSQ